MTQAATRAPNDEMNSLPVSRPATAAVVAEYTTFPIDTLRAKEQGRERIITYSVSSGKINGSVIVRQLYSGVSLAIIRQTMVSTLKLSIFLFGSSLYGSSNNMVWANGMISGALATILINPLDVIKNHRQTATCVPSKNISTIYKEIVQAHGMNGFMHGIKFNVLRGSIISTGEYGTYFYLKNNYEMNPCISGAIAGAATGIIVHPIDRIRNKIQYATNKPNGTVPPHPWKLSEYFRGFKYAVLRRTLFNSVFFCLL